MITNIPKKKKKNVSVVNRVNPIKNMFLKMVVWPKHVAQLNK
jgi:hypothetical protein